MTNIWNRIREWFNKISEKAAGIFSAVRERFSRPQKRSAKPQRADMRTSRRPRRLTFWQKAERFFRDLWRGIAEWIRTADRRLVYGLAGAAVVVIALPIVLICTLGGGSSAEEEIPAEAPQQTAVVTATQAPTIMVVSQDELDAEAGIETVDPYSIDPATVSLSYGDDDPLVSALQERFMELGYMDEDIPTEHYGSQTKNAVIYFQRKNGLTMDGGVGPQTYQLLFSYRKEPRGTTLRICSPGFMNWAISNR